jgi:hypothetical protein
MGVRGVASMSMEVNLVFSSPKRGAFILILRDELVSHDKKSGTPIAPRMRVRVVFTFSNTFVAEEVSRVMMM